jgi:hypothetical protein
MSSFGEGGGDRIARSLDWSAWVSGLSSRVYVGAAGEALIAAVRVVGELHGRRGAGLGQLPHGGDPVPGQGPGRGRDQMPAIAVELLLGLPADLLPQGLEALREPEIPAVLEDHDGADALALGELDGEAVLLLLVARVEPDGLVA